MADEKREFEYKRLSLITGAVLLVILILVHVLIAPIPVWVLALPGFLMGIDPREFLNTKK